MVYLEIGNKRYSWDGNSISKSSITEHSKELIRLGMESDSFNLVLEHRSLKAVFFDLGDTLIKATLNDSTHTLTNITVFPETEEIISSLRDKGIKLGIISNGSQSLFETLPDDQKLELKTLFSKFDVVIMSDDDDVGVRKPHKKIFEKAILQLDPNLDPLSTAFIAEDKDINHFKIYNLLFIQKLKDISSFV